MDHLPVRMRLTTSSGSVWLVDREAHALIRLPGEKASVRKDDGLERQILDIVLLEVGEPAIFLLPAPTKGVWRAPYQMGTSRVTSIEDAEAEWDRLVAEVRAWRERLPEECRAAGGPRETGASR